MKIFKPDNIDEQQEPVFILAPSSVRRRKYHYISTTATTTTHRNGNENNENSSDQGSQTYNTSMNSSLSSSSYSTHDQIQTKTSIKELTASLRKAKLTKLHEKLPKTILLTKEDEDTFYLQFRASKSSDDDDSTKNNSFTRG